MRTARDLVWVGAGLLVHVLGCAASPRAPALALRDRAAGERFNEQGLALIEQNRPGEAEQAFRRAIEADPFCGVAHCNLGMCLLQQGTAPFDAAWSFRHAARLMPKATQPRIGLALLYERASQAGQAEEALREALALEPDSLEVVGSLARLHIRQGKFTNETRDWLKTVALLEPDPTWRQWAQAQLSLNPLDGDHQ